MPETAEFERQLEMNRRAYESLRDKITSKYAAQYVGIAFGKIVAVDPDYFTVCASSIPCNRHPSIISYSRQRRSRV